MLDWNNGNVDGFGAAPKRAPHRGMWGRQWQGHESPHGSGWSLFVHDSIKKCGCCCRRALGGAPHSIPQSPTAGTSSQQSCSQKTPRSGLDPPGCPSRGSLEPSPVSLGNDSHLLPQTQLPGNPSEWQGARRSPGESGMASPAFGICCARGILQVQSSRGAQQDLRRPQGRAGDTEEVPGVCPGMGQDPPSLGMSSVPWESSSSTTHRSCSMGWRLQRLQELWRRGWIQTQALECCRSDEFRGVHPSIHPSPELPKPLPALPVGSPEGHSGRSSQERWPSPGIDVLGREGREDLLQRSPKHLPRVGDPITSALLPGKIPCGAGRLLEKFMSCFFWIPVPDLKLQVVF